jgi:hypothetical protein
MGGEFEAGQQLMQNLAGEYLIPDRTPAPEAFLHLKQDYPTEKVPQGGTSPQSALILKNPTKKKGERT